MISLKPQFSILCVKMFSKKTRQHLYPQILISMCFFNPLLEQTSHWSASSLNVQSKAWTYHALNSSNHSTVTPPTHKTVWITVDQIKYADQIFTPSPCRIRWAPAEICCDSDTLWNSIQLTGKTVFGQAQHSHVLQKQLWLLIWGRMHGIVFKLKCLCDFWWSSVQQLFWCRSAFYIVIFMGWGFWPSTVLRQWSASEDRSVRFVLMSATVYIPTTVFRLFLLPSISSSSPLFTPRVMF